MASFAISGPLGPDVKIGLLLPGFGTRAARVASCDGRSLVIEMAEEMPEGALEEGSVVDLLLPLSWGMYKWLCLVSCHPGEKKAEVELLDAPMFIQRRLDPRVGVGLPGEICILRGTKRGEPHEAVVADLSHGGLKLEQARQLRTGDLVEVKLDLSATLVSFTGPVALAGRVVMAYPSPSGAPGATDAHVCFLEGQPEAIDAVDRFVAQQLQCRWEV